MDGSIKIQYQPPEYSPHGSVQRPPGSSVRGSELRSTGASKQKLPHGLTVHELKEMTKARLQAEAADKPVEQTENEDNRRLSPLDFDSVPEVRERASSRDSGLNNNGTFLSHGPGSTNSIPSMVQVSQQPRDPNFERQPQVSPLPAGFQSSSSGGSAFHQPRVDASESVSVASHNSAAVSENYGSESMYSGGPSSGYGPSNESEFQYGIGSGFAGHQAPLSAHASPSDGNSYYDTSIGGNRRRAITLSPRGISIHEDRPIHGGLRMPNFTSASRATLSSRPSRNFSPVLGLGLDDAFLGQNVGLAPLGGTDLNRPRTSSATSLPIRSHDGLDFNRDRANTFNGFSTGQPRDDGLSESVSNALTDSFLRVSGNESRRAMNRNFGFSDGVSAPPGFTSNSISRSSTAGNFAALAAGGSFGNRQDPWEDAARSSPLFTADGVDDMADSMGSILKLSGVGSDRPDRERSHTYPYGAFH